ESELSADFAKQFGGRAAQSPLWEVLRQPISVHNLGGCPMASQPGAGVTDAHGQVYEYPGLYVMDGAILPAATGVNPSHTIAAVAERNIEAAIRKITNQPSWRAPQMAETAKINDPLAGVTVPKEGTALPVTAPVRITFKEKL